MLDYRPPKSVVVGIDGSDAAVWAADKVAGTDTALRLLCINEQTLTDNPRSPAGVGNCGGGGEGRLPRD